MQQIKMALGTAALDLKPSYRICQKSALEMLNSENCSLKKCKWYIHVLSHAQVSYLLETEDCNFTTNRKVFVVTLLLIHLLLSQRKQKEVMFISIAHILTPALVFSLR